MADDANSLYFDAAIRHQVGIRRMTAFTVKQVLRFLEEVDRDMVAQLRQRLARLGPADASFTTDRFRRLIQDVRMARHESMVELGRRVRPDLLELARMEIGFEERIIQAAVPFQVDFAQVDLAQVRAAVFSRPFQGRLLREWFRSLELADARRMQDAIRLGVAQGETIPDMVRRIAGTRAQGFRNGTLAVTRRQAEAVVRTAVNHVTNAARETMWDANEDIIAALRWTSVLDGRTSAICRARDGKLAPIGDKPLPPDSDPLSPPGARPPAHVSCRAAVLAVLDGEGLVGKRPFVVDTRTPQRRRVDFRREARRTGRPIQEIRSEWAKKNIGQVPAETTYNQWLRRQSAGFQDEVLGKTKGKLFRKGELDVDQFVDRSGNELSLEELAKTQPEAFAKAGV